MRSAEHVIFSGQATRRLLLVILNSFITTGHVPKSFQKEIIIPIHKGKGKSTYDPGNYRGITLSSTHCKLMDVPDELQHGFQEEHSCALTAISLIFIMEGNTRCKQTIQPFWMQQEPLTRCGTQVFSINCITKELLAMYGTYSTMV